MKSVRTFLLTASLLALVLVAFEQRTQAGLTSPGLQKVAAVAPFSDPFTEYGSPSSPTPWTPSGWDVDVHTRNNYQYSGIDATQAGHGVDCSAPPSTHPVTTDVAAVFVCKNHVMTAMNAGGYGVIYLVPDHMIDFSNGTTTLFYNVSTQRTSLRDWTDLWVTPFGDNLELPLESWLPDLQGPPKDAVHIKMDQFNDDTNFQVEVYRDFRAQQLNSQWWVTESSFLTTSATVRSTFELDISRTHIRFGMPAFHLWWVDTSISDLGWSRGVVQLGHHSYTPDKGAGCGPPKGQVGGCQPDTWHWGGISMTSAVPFTMIKAVQRRIWPGTTTRASFPRGAPHNAFLRFDAVGTIQVSYDGGGTWVNPRQPPESKHVAGQFENYMTPIPAGTRTVLFRGQNWYGGPWFARDLSIWATSGTPSP